MHACVCKSENKMKRVIRANHRWKDEMKVLQKLSVCVRLLVACGHKIFNNLNSVFQSQLVDCAARLYAICVSVRRIHKDAAAKLFTIIDLFQPSGELLSKIIIFSITCVLHSVSGLDLPLRPALCPSSHCPAEYCSCSYLWRRIAKDAVICTHRSPLEREWEKRREPNLIWKAPVQRLGLASLFGSWQSQEIKAKRRATNVCFCRWRFVCMFDQQPPLSPWLTLLLICSNGLPFMRQEMGAWCKGCDWGEWSRWGGRCAHTFRETWQRAHV